MNIIKKAMTLSLGLVLIGSAAFAQSLADAQKAIDAEQYQKATTMLKALTTSSSKPINYFYLGEVYLKTDDIDSARATFNKGIAMDAKSELNYIGLGHSELLLNNATAAKANFDKAVDLAKKDYNVYLQIGKAYITQPKPDFAAALPYLTKADELDVKDEAADIYIALGDYYALQKLNSEALGKYLAAINLNTSSLRPLVQIGRMYTNAYNFIDAEIQLKDAIKADPNYGPAYRELAETQMQWSNFSPKDSKERKASALDNYRKYLSLTDKSFDSRLRYAQFLVYGADFKTLEEVSAGLAVDNPNPAKSLLISRLRGYSAFENGNIPQSLQFMNEVFQKSQGDSTKLFHSDYAYLGKAQLASNLDSLALINLKKATLLDSTNADALSDVAKKYVTNKKYGQAADILTFAIKEYPKSPQVLQNNYYLATYSYLDYYYQNQKKLNPSKDILIRADSAYAYVIRISPETEPIYLGRAKVAQFMDDSLKPVGLARPFYEQYIQMVTVTKPEKAQEPANVRGLIEAYNYLGYLLIDKDNEKAAEYFNKTLALDPTNSSAVANIKYLTAAMAASKKAPEKK